ncbi:MAG: ParB/RepB/Spo0J family partition protein [Clostridia bacterium]|nr:ParB/RepB/Spo0J family partition protein [Clostridia bacterium]
MATVKKGGLGKGLGALLVENSIDTGITEVDIMSVEPAKDQPRKVFDPEKLEDLADSIREHGLIQPIVVNKSTNGYTIIAGERRWRAARMAGLLKIPVIIKDVTPKEMRELALIENIQREDLNPIEEALAYRQLVVDYELTQEELAGIVGNKSRSEIANRMRLLNLDEKVQELIINGQLTAGQARPLLALTPEQQITVANAIVERGLNARQIEALVKQLQKRGKSTEDDDKAVDKALDTADSNVNASISRDIEYMQNQLRSSLGTKVKLDDRGGRGKIVIEYYSKDERERLLEYLLRKP